MVKVRAWLFACLLLVVTGSVYAQLERIAKYTSLPTYYAEEKAYREKADWCLKAFFDPAIPKQETARFTVILGKQSYEMPKYVESGPSAIRADLAKVLVADAQFDPAFEAVLKIAGTPTEDRFLAVLGVALLHDTVRTYVKGFPGVAQPAREIFLAALEDKRADVKYMAIKGLAVVGNSDGSRQVTEALLKELAGDSEGLVEAAATALADMGEVGAVRPLMERFQTLKEDVDQLQAGDDSPTAGIPGPPLNEARLAIATGVGRLTGIDRELNPGGIYRRSVVLDKYAELTKWWEENKDKYP